MSFNLNTSLETFIDVMKKVLYPNGKRKLIDSYDCSRYDLTHRRVSLPLKEER